MKKFAFPSLERVRIKQFSLYRKRDLIDVDLSKNVVCLTGANGLGKSTFITILNYALTGIVRNPDRRFSSYNSISAFFNKNKGFASDYFDGRITESDYDSAEVSIDFRIGNNAYSITRGFFEPDQLRTFTRTVDDVITEFPEDASESRLNGLYKEHLTRDLGLAEFEQFVFLQFYVFVFDETHQLLFWDESLIERVLYLFFGVDPAKAKKADQLRKDYHKFDSEARNTQWKITQARKDVKALTESLDEIISEDSSAVAERHRALLEDFEELESRRQKTESDLSLATLVISELSLESVVLRNEYKRLFNATLRTETPIEDNPDVIYLLNDMRLRLRLDQPVDDLITKLIETIKNADEPAETSAEVFEKLKDIDSRLLEISGNLHDAQSRESRLVGEVESIDKSLLDVRSKIAAIENENAELISKLFVPKDGKGTESILSHYREQIVRFTEQKEEAYRRRDKAREELAPLEEELSVGYVEAEREFIPLFNQYAKSFLGLELSINLSTSSKGITSLSIDIDDSHRSEAFQLSESQRYFVDIALRMALVDLIADSATLYIDTPEGSLDIAYESKAGEMFAQYASGGRRLVMTANINTSQLLLELAKICKSERMNIERMTDWTVMSNVQQDENERIEEAFSNIALALGD